MKTKIKHWQYCKTSLAKGKKFNPPNEFMAQADLNDGKYINLRDDPPLYCLDEVCRKVIGGGPI
eukprot:11948356-Ditylum_brightwellii.AAC.1